MAIYAAVRIFFNNRETGKIFNNYSAIVLGVLMTTTIQIENPTKDLLNELKKSFRSKTYDEVIVSLVRKKTKSMYGKLSKGKKVSVSKLMKNLRDKSDRY